MSHFATVKRTDDLEIEAECSCGSWLIMTVEEGTNIIRTHSFNSLCPAVNLAFRRLKKRDAA